MGSITISRQLGSHGARVARGVARKLGWPLADKATINTVIREYGLTQLDDIYGPKPPRFWDLFENNKVWTIEWMNKTIQAIAAQEDAVILGRGGFAVLGGYADVLNVFIKASDDVRAHRIGLRDDISQADAAEKVAADDKARAKFTRLFYSLDWADESNFDLVLDTGEVTDEVAMDRIIEAYRAKISAAPAGPSIAELVPDALLAESVRGRFGKTSQTH
ncbi:cytidylate kinase-like family protein [Tessaracoccus sp. HDW20]|uniref:cytidylate kinase-like family protein n=1 Tax=Tessaracoccus coleopterorum TaxID=2714950 RepID=UPI0018D4764F|nr:cytidylate kinase-like family protein [Tessaracoccus coleopterorum]NHB85817.1 cytidylate kinase-like family protein [Tessaracoccus coleopterorum]